jgi:hypothetical protein
VIDRRADRVLRHCASCRLSWTADADLADAAQPKPEPERQG